MKIIISVKLLFKVLILIGHIFTKMAYYRMTHEWCIFKDIASCNCLLKAKIEY